MKAGKGAGGGRRAVFLDRDGTLNEEVGFLDAVDRLRLIPRAAEAIRRLNEAGLPVLVVTSQSGIARGLFDVARLDEIHAALRAHLAQAGARLDGIYVCPHHPREGVPPWRRECDCRKPRPGLLRRAAREHGVDPASSYMIGDKAADIETARNAGATGILVLTGYGAVEKARIPVHAPPDHVAADLFEAVRWILQREEEP